MDFLTYWIEAAHGSIRNRFPKTLAHRFVAMRVPTQCPVCQRPLKLKLAGDANNRSLMDDSKCEHFQYYTDLMKHCEPYNPICPQCGNVHI